MGERVTVEERFGEMLRRHGPESPHARAHLLRGPLLLAAGRRVEERMRAGMVTAATQLA